MIYRSIIKPELTWTSAESLKAVQDSLVASLGQERAAAKTEYWVVEQVEDPQDPE